MKELTERLLLDTYNTISPHGKNISLIGGQKIYWTYRECSRGWDRVCAPRNASHIVVERRTGTIPISAKLQFHPTVPKIMGDEARLRHTLAQLFGYKKTVVV